MYKRTNQGWLKHWDFILLDILALFASFVMAYYIRHGNSYVYFRKDYNTLAVILLASDLFISVLFNTMHNVLKRTAMEEALQSAKQAALVLAAVSLYMFSVQMSDISRITIYLTAGIHFVLGFLLRMAWKPVVRKINQRKHKTTILLLADEEDIPAIKKQAKETDGTEFSGAVLLNRNAKGESISDLSIASNLAEAADYICREWIDKVFIYPHHFSQIDENEDNSPSLGSLITQCREMGIPVHIRLPLADVGGKMFTEKIGGYDVLTTTINYASPIQLAIKRLIDIIGGIFGSIAALIIMAIVGPKIKKESPGPILFKQTRIGKNGKRFTCYKIRSMYMDAEERKKELLAQNRYSDDMMFKLEWDPRIIGNKIVDGKQVTGIGEKIRKSSLDEFPQFFNILLGQMSLVGTRPPTVDEWEKYKYHHRARLATKPGLTGLWQVSGRSEITDFEEVVKLDTEYINNWSLALDFKILLKTVKTVINKDGAM